MDCNARKTKTKKQLLYLWRRLLFRTANTVRQSNGKQPAAVFLLGYVFLLLLLCRTLKKLNKITIFIQKHVLHHTRLLQWCCIAFKSFEIPYRAQHLEGLYCLLGLPDSDDGATIVRNVGNLNSNHMALNSPKAKFPNKSITAGLISLY
jgi:hypothetical protein